MHSNMYVIRRIWCETVFFVVALNMFLFSKNKAPDFFMTSFLKHVSLQFDYSSAIKLNGTLKMMIFGYTVNASYAHLTGVCAVLWCTFQQPVVGLSPGVTVLTGQDAHRLFVRLPGLRPDPQQLAVDLTLCHSGAVAVINLQLEELVENQEAIFVTAVLNRWFDERC